MQWLFDIKKTKYIDSIMQIMQSIQKMTHFYWLHNTIQSYHYKMWYTMEHTTFTLTFIIITHSFFTHIQAYSSFLSLLNFYIHQQLLIYFRHIHSHTHITKYTFPTIHQGYFYSHSGQYFHHTPFLALTNFALWLPLSIFLIHLVCFFVFFLALPIIFFCFALFHLHAISLSLCVSLSLKENNVGRMERRRKGRVRNRTAIKINGKGEWEGQERWNNYERKELEMGRIKM